MIYRPPPDPTQAPVVPIYIGPRNCEHVTGQPWRWTREHAVRLGVPVLRIGGKSMVCAAQLRAAMDAEAARSAPRDPVVAREPTVDDLAEQLGYRRVAAR